MLRYSLIHHDVREKFELTINDYLVIDAIHQLSHQKPTKKPNTQIANFLGIDERSVRRGKEVGCKKELLVELPIGVKTTEKWVDEVIFAKEGRQNAEETRQNAEPDSAKCRDTIININNKTNGPSEDGEEISPYKKTDQDGNPIEPKPPKDKSLNSLVLGVFSLFRGVNPAWVEWRINTAQRNAAKVLIEKYGQEKVKNFFEASQRYKDEPFAPQVNSPYDLLNKLAQLKAHEERRNSKTN